MALGQSTTTGTLIACVQEVVPAGTRRDGTTYGGFTLRRIWVFNDPDTDPEAVRVYDDAAWSEARRILSDAGGPAKVEVAADVRGRGDFVLRSIRAL